MERLRALVGRGGWDFCVLWELSNDQRSLELKACCCGGVDGGGDEDVSLSWDCRDSSFPRHQRTGPCASLAELPTSVPLESNSSPATSHAQVFLSGMPNWTHPSQLLIRPDCPDEERRTTRVLVPVPGGVVELFVENYVPEDGRTVEFILSQFSGNNPSTAFSAEYQMHRDLDGYGGLQDEHPPWGLHPVVASSDHHTFPWDPPSDQSRLCVSPLDLFEGHREEDGFFEGSSDSVHSDKRSFPFDPLPGFHQPARNPTAQIAYTSTKESVKQEGEGRTDSFFDGSDQMGDEDEEQKMGRSERRPSCKNLMAERKRRKKLNDRLYDLRSLVPKISKMDKASILGDAIEFVKDLQSQVKKLQEQLEEATPADGGRETHEIQQTEIKARSSKEPRVTPATEKKENQMEPQVEVSQIGANKFFLRVFCEHRRGGFVRLMEAMASLGFDVVNLNVTTSEPLVLNVFEVEKRDSEVVQADQVRSSLLRLAMDSEDSRLQL